MIILVGKVTISARFKENSFSKDFGTDTFNRSFLRLQCSLPASILQLANYGSYTICVVIKQNESEVGTNDMLLVSNQFHTSNICQKNLKPVTCEPLQYKALYSLFIRSTMYVTAIMYLRQVTGFSIVIVQYLIKLLKPVTCRSQLPTHSD